MATDASFSEIKHYIDLPRSWEWTSHCLRVHGWCYVTNGQLLQRIRLRAAGMIFPGVVGMPRPDVKAVYPEAPGNDTGFEIRGVVPAGHVDIVIEAEFTPGIWQVVLAREITVTRPRVPLWLGGGGWTELMYTQVPGHMIHPPHAIRPEKFPALTRAAHPPRMSIVTPSYNQARFLPETVRSVLEQPGIDCEYVVQDGGSTDGSQDAIRPYVDRLRAFESARDSGQADAIAKGFAKTSGGPDDLMAWINSDDFYLPGALAFVADYFARHPEIDVLYGNRVLVNEDSQEIARWFLPKHDAEVLRLSDFVPQETLFWRRRLWDKVGGIDTSFKFAMDWDLLLRFQATGARIVHVPYFLACFRIHAAQKTTAQIHSIGQEEIWHLRDRALARHIPVDELESHPLLRRYLRRSAWIQFLSRFGIRTA